MRQKFADIRDVLANRAPYVGDTERGGEIYLLVVADSFGGAL
jgi:hypothetical protein